MAIQNYNIYVDNVKGVHDLALNSSFGRDCHAQQVAPGRHQASACTFRIGIDSRSKLSSKKLRIATWNIRTLYQLGKLDNVIQEMDRMLSASKDLQK